MIIYRFTLSQWWWRCRQHQTPAAVLAATQNKNTGVFMLILHMHTCIMWWVELSCFQKGYYQWRTLTSSLQISLMNSWASFMAPGVGANTEKVSSSTWFIVTPWEDRTNFQFQRSLTKCVLLSRPKITANDSSFCDVSGRVTDSLQYQFFAYLFQPAACEGCSPPGRRSALVWKQARALFLWTESNCEHTVRFYKESHHHDLLIGPAVIPTYQPH